MREVRDKAVAFLALSPVKMEQMAEVEEMQKGHSVVEVEVEVTVGLGLWVMGRVCTREVLARLPVLL